MRYTNSYYITYYIASTKPEVYTMWMWTYNAMLPEEDQATTTDSVVSEIYSLADIHTGPQTHILRLSQYTLPYRC